MKHCSICEGLIWWDANSKRWWHSIDGLIGRCTAEEYERQVVFGCYNKAEPKR